jgi:hypothetical protein
MAINHKCTWGTDNRALIIGTASPVKRALIHQSANATAPVQIPQLAP